MCPARGHWEDHVKRVPLLLAAVLIIPACGDSKGGFTPVPAASQKPSAIVPENKKVLTGAAGVSLDGSKSFDPAAGAPPLTFLWEQTAGTLVTLSSTTAAAPTFTAPGAPGDLTFRLTVTGAQGTDSASVTVHVKTFIVVAPDTWFVGYGNAGSITPAVTGTTTSPAYLWTGLEPWFPVTSSLTSLVLTYSATPALTDFQNFPDRAGVQPMERTTQGRLQLKIKVTDGAESDEDFVNFSVGPFSDSVANENVALGEPVFLNGAATIPQPSPTPPATITTWTWSGTKPNGTTPIDFKKPNKAAATTADRFVYFIPDVPGTYSVQVRQNDGTPQAISKFFTVISGSYVGVGNLTGKTPDPFAGECAACHAGQLPWLADFANPWKQTGHARMLETILDPTNPFYTASQAKERWVDFFNFGSNYSIDSRTIGWSRISTKTNGGWTEPATSEGCVLTGASWEDVVRRHPKTAAKSNVQCESCHGPGSEHAGDSSMIRKSYDALVCGRCHSRKQDFWEVSGHGSTTSPAYGVSGSASCNGCHSAQGYVVEMRAQEGADPHTALFAVSNIARPVIPPEDRRSITCQACHEPHKKTPNRPAQPGPDPQLRAWGNVKFRNDAVGFGGESATCFTCHQSRTDARPNSPDWNIRRAPHDSTAAEMLSGTNGMQFAGWTYANSPHADSTRFIVPGQSQARQCITCHSDMAPAKGQDGFGAIGGHTFRMSHGDGVTVALSQGAGGSTTAGTRTFTFTQASPVLSFLKKAYPGDKLTLTGPEAGDYTIDSVDSARQVTVRGTGTFGGGLPTSWSVTSMPKHSVATCIRCHPAAPDFRNAARHDYDGNNSLNAPVQDEIAGLRLALQSAIDARVTTLVGSPATLSVASGRIKYTITAGSLVRTFPGPGVSTGDNPDISYNSLDAAGKAAWDAVYAAAYNWVFVGNDHSEGIHNTGYAVNLLQSSYQALTGSPIGQPFVPY
jgi:hypothetical protein